MNLWLAFSDNAVTDPTCAQFLEPIIIDYETALIDTDAADTNFATPELT